MKNHLCVRTAKWRRSYVDGVVILSGYKFWPGGGEGKVILNPDLVVSKKDKQEKKRKKGRNESPPKKAPKNVKRTVTCSVCKQTKHNFRFHKDKEASQGKSASEGKFSKNGPSQDPQASQGTLTEL
ncbi:hypothetical protein AALP_AA6G237300 [Arabis alpina]|uniref:Uncharacterized protein n=1 Tax=Arabis alpina TaxID=50452 RepID=A0A087GRA3_ARAAL|nr:hypothetical protein AALP_AA6G237300 [Arabis alpina]